ncbi:c-type cytochrome [Desulfuromonas versatilis]|uniref:C-type cytochrome n=1 Tax=Desulfuromonas versatilis TaxID=2802975 RepID=A0ABN6E505_9BACT|nr:hypothetical protein [Desulfuromonas versatilis]BCR06774.1 c-type cytochrome [Desulfuromonas versatilis]
MKKSTLTLLALAAALSFTLWGCGSNRGSDSSSTPATVAIEDAGTTGNCTLCHTLDVHTQISGIAGQNPDLTNGFGSRVTHDCEACHGGGQFHHGEGPIPFPAPNAERCGECHTQTNLILASKHNAENPENVEMLADGHDTRYCQRCHTAEGSIAFKSVVGDKATVTAAIVANGDPVGPGQVEALANVDGQGNPVLHAPVCGACHNALTKQMVTVDPAWDPNQNGVSDQFDLCTSCHNYQLNDGTMFGSGSVDSGTAQFYHDTAWYRTLPTTHYDDPNTPAGQGNEDLAAVPPVINQIEGYVIRMNSANPCFDCHGHELKTNTRPRAEGDERGAPTIHTQWASSGHAAKVFVQKRAAAASFDPDTDGDGILHPENAPRSAEVVDAVMAAYGSDGSSNGGFTHYDWDAQNRQSCQMCHTATGFVNYVADPAGYDAADNDFSHLSGWSVDAATGTVTPSPQNELLYCWGCHTSAESGALRVQGAVTASYTVGGEAVVFPDSGSSNTCIVCHSGRGNNETVSTSSRFAGHHAPAAATLFSELTHVGAEFPGLSYANKPYFAHDSISVDGAGPCASCHMSGDMPNHEFAVVEKNDSGVITGIVADVCVSCHDGEHALFVAQGQVGQTLDIWNGTAAVPTVVTQQMADDAAAVLEEEAEEYQEAGQLLVDLLANTVANYAGVAIDNSSVVENDLRAFQNSKLHVDEKGGFAHNRYYVKRLIFDSIDYLEDGSLDGTIADYTATYPGAANWLGATRP